MMLMLRQLTRKTKVIEWLARVRQRRDWMDAEHFPVVVVGAGWAGLGVSFRLAESGIRHQVLESGRIGNTWRTKRWDSFHLNTVNIQSVLPGDTYKGTDPDGFMNRDEFVALLEEYALRNRLPVIEGERVLELRRESDNTFAVRSSNRTVRASSVVVASGSLSRGKRPSFANQLAGDILQIDASDYRNPDQLPAGAVLVVGSGQSGGQIAEDLALANRKVFISTGHIGRMPRRYRGGDSFVWAATLGMTDVRREDFVNASSRPMSRSLLGALHTISLQSLSRIGIVLLGRCEGLGKTGDEILIADDLAENIRFGDESSERFKGAIDAYIEKNDMTAPPRVDDPAETVTPNVPSPPIRSLHLREREISTIVWCTGFEGDYDWIRISEALGEDRQPNQHACRSPVPGLYFAGVDFSTTRKSGTILSIEEESRTIVDEIIKHRESQ